jgi:hypothetical protein
MEFSATVKRVAFDFNWPIGKVWEGYINPWPGPEICEQCGGFGYNAATTKLLDTFETWSKKLTKDEKSVLTLKYGQTMVNTLLEGELTIEHPDFYEVRYDLIEIRATRKGFFGYCQSCGGEGEVPNTNPAVVSLYEGVNLFEEWRPVEPPSGEGWQLWDNRAPLSAVFNSAEALAEWCHTTYRKKIKQDLPMKDWLEWIHQEVNKSSPRQFTKRVLSLPSEFFRITPRLDQGSN